MSTCTLSPNSAIRAVAEKSIFYPHFVKTLRSRMVPDLSAIMSSQPCVVGHFVFLRMLVLARPSLPRELSLNVPWNSLAFQGQVLGSAGPESQERGSGMRYASLSFVHKGWNVAWLMR